eukprot:symbB.v1.2.033125.t1/scaffold4073.1/size45213/2
MGFFIQFSSCSILLSSLWRKLGPSNEPLVGHWIQREIHNPRETFADPKSSAWEKIDMRIHGEFSNNYDGENLITVAASAGFLGCQKSTVLPNPRSWLVARHWFLAELRLAFTCHATHLSFISWCNFEKLVLSERSRLRFCRGLASLK